MTNALFWVKTQLVVVILTDVCEQPIRPIFRVFVFFFSFLDL